MAIVNTHPAKTHLSELIDRALQGEEIILAKANEPKVKLVPFQKKQMKRKPGALKGKIWISKDFDTTDMEIEKLFYEEN